MKICVVGAGYVGLVAGVGFALKGHDVACIEVSPKKVESINRGVPPFEEPGLKEALEQCLATGRLEASTDLGKGVKGSEVVFICVQTPTMKDGRNDLSALIRVIPQITSEMNAQDDYQVVVVKSTVVPTTTESTVLPLLRSGLSKPFGLCTNPEFLREGNALEDFVHPDRIVVGALDDRSADVLEKLYKGFHTPFFRASISTVETIKYTSNALLATAISFSNEIANICELIPGVDVQEVMQAIHLDHRLSPEHEGERVRPGFLSYLVAGCGFGGSCLPKDLTAFRTFASDNGYQPTLLEAVGQINRQRPVRLVEMAANALGSLDQQKVAVLGLAFKPDTDDMRESPAVSVVDELLRRGATVQAYDPQAMESANSIWQGFSNFSCCPTLEDAMTGADAAIVVTAWPEFEALSSQTIIALMREPVVVDGRRILAVPPNNPPQYLGIGRRWQ